MRPIYLIGFMCSGKTTLGKAIQRLTGIEFIDLDEYIERQAGMTVRQIFDEYGEGHFRKLENEALQNIAARDNVIVACGGGTPCQPGAMELMNQTGTTVRLVPSERRLVRRLMAGRRKRPLLSNINTPAEMRDFMIFTIAQREQHYGKAQCRFDSTYLDTPDEVTQTVEKFIAQFLNPETQP